MKAVAGTPVVQKGCACVAVMEAVTEAPTAFLQCPCRAVARGIACTR